MRILIAEDEPVSRKMLGAALKRMGHEVVATENGQEAWNTLQSDDELRLVIADWEMPEMNGLDLVHQIRAELAPKRYTYIILLTARADKADIVVGLEAGADDYLTKPFDPQELKVRIKAGQRIIELEGKLAELSRIDQLTQIPNRRSFEEQLTRLSEQATRYGRHFSVVMMDVDFFKKYNDSLGHEAGDGALRSVAHLLAGALRTADHVFRYGGEEFVCLLPETPESGARSAAERMRAAVEAARIPHPHSPAGVVTVSVGMAGFSPNNGVTPNQILGHADRALYEAKANGRNRVVIFDPARTPLTPQGH